MDFVQAHEQILSLVNVLTPIFNKFDEGAGKIKIDISFQDKYADVKIQRIISLSCVNPTKIKGKFKRIGQLAETLINIFDNFQKGGSNEQI